MGLWSHACVTSFANMEQRLSSFRGLSLAQTRLGDSLRRDVLPRVHSRSRQDKAIVRDLREADIWGAHAPRVSVAAPRREHTWRSTRSATTNLKSNLRCVRRGANAAPEARAFPR